jgi:hypothetical protein
MTPERLDRCLAHLYNRAIAEATPVEKKTKSRCMFCGRESPKSVCEVCKARVESEVRGTKKKEKDRTE